MITGVLPVFLLLGYLVYALIYAARRFRWLRKGSDLIATFLLVLMVLARPLGSGAGAAD